MIDSKHCAPETQDQAKVQSAEAEACRLAAHMMVSNAFSKAIHNDQTTTLQQVRLMIGLSLCAAAGAASLLCHSHQRYVKLSQQSEVS